MQLPLAYLDLTAIEEVPVDLWRRLFAAVGWPTSLADQRDAFTHADVLAAFEQDSLGDELLLALEALHVLGTGEGCEAITAAMQDQRVPRDVLPSDTSERELAVHLFLAQRDNASLADVFARAQTEAQERGASRCYHEFMGRSVGHITDLTRKRDLLRDATLEYCREGDLGDHVQVRAFEDDGTYVLHVIRSHHTRKPLAVLPGSSARAAIAYRPVHGDILRYEAAVGRLRIAARAPSIVPFYRRALGRVLFGDEEFFTGAPVCSLRVLQERGREALERHDVPGIGRVRMTECLWERGDGDLVHIRSSDCFRNIEELRLPLSQGQLIQAKLKVEVAAKSTRPVTVSVRVPSRIDVRQRSYEPLIEHYLTRIGVRDAKLQSAEIDLWSLHPWRHAPALWRTVFGRETDGLVERGVLSPVRLQAVSSPEVPDAGKALRAHELPDHEFYGVATDPAIPARSLTLTDLDGLELDPERLRQELRSRLAIQTPAVAWSAADDVLDLGVLELSGHRIHLHYALRPPQPGLGERLRMRSPGAHPVLLIPSRPYGGSDLPTAMLETPLPSREQAVRAAVAAAGLTDAVPALLSAPDGARLVVDTVRGTVWVDGIEITGLKPDTQPFKFVEMLARRAPSPVSAWEITSTLSGARKDDTTAARQAKRNAGNIIREALARAGRSVESELFPICGKAAYRCPLVSYVV